jgi:hypothetical protein
MTASGAPDLLPLADPQLADDPRGGSGQLVLHLHRLEDDEHVAGLDLRTLGHRELDHLPRHGRRQRALAECLLAGREARELPQAGLPERAVDVVHVAGTVDRVAPRNPLDLEFDGPGGE